MEGMQVDGRDASSSLDYFTKVSARRVWGTDQPQTLQVALCPSMDLMALGVAAAAPSSSSQQKTTTSKGEKDTSTGASTLWLYRTVSGQNTTQPKVASVNLSSDDASNNEDVRATQVTWRPDGRILALTDTDQNLTLFSVEEIVSSSAGSSSMSAASVSKTDFASASSSHYASLKLPDFPGGSSNSPTTGILWAHVGKPHPSWERTAQELEQDCFWEYRSRFVDRAYDFLPPSDYHNHYYNHQHNPESRADATATPSSVLPTCRTPLSIVAVTTVQTGLNLYAHGRYPLLLGLPVSGVSLLLSSTTRRRTRRQHQQQQGLEHHQLKMEMVASTDLTHFLLYPHDDGSSSTLSPSSKQNQQQQQHVLTLYSIPALAQERYTLQTLSACSCALQAHLQVLRTSLTEVAASWKSSIKPLDLKLDGLTKLLSNYGLLMAENDDDNTESSSSNNKTVTGYLVQYMLSGHSRTAPDLSNAVDQFFTGVQMNDQLLQRMERSLTVAVANVETQLRRNLLSPAQALVYITGDLYGLARSFSDNHCDSDDSLLLSCQSARLLQESSAALLMAVEKALTELIDARFRLRDFCAWLRSTGAQIKASGTAANSVQRQNAKKRRVSDAVQNRMLRYLQETDEHDGVTRNKESSITERVLGLKFASLLQEGGDNLRSDAPTSVKRDTAFPFDKSTLTLPLTIDQTKNAAERLLAEPRAYLRKSVYCTHLVLQSAWSSSSSTTSKLAAPIVAITTRMGQGGVVPENVPFGEEHQLEDSFFAPLEVNATATSCAFTSPATATEASEYRQWTIIAEAGREEASRKGDCIRLHALPLTWTATGEDDDDYDIVDETEAEQPGLATPFFWTCCLSLPDNYTIRDIAFYGDDGKSSLSSGIDSGTGKERRQKLVLLVCPDAPRISHAELWLVPYDRVPFCRLPLKNVSDGHFGLDVDEADLSGCRVAVHATPDEQQGDSVPDRVVYAKTRRIFFSSPFVDGYPPCRLMVSGSRGMAMAMIGQNGSTAIDLFDLEEDEEVESEYSDDEDGAAGGEEESMEVDE